MRKNRQNRMLTASLVLLLVGASILIAVASGAARREKPAMPETTESETEREEKLPLETIFDKLTALQQAEDTDALAAYADVLYTQAQLIEGILPEDPAAYVEKVLSLIG